MSDVFISYKREDRHLAKQLAETLESDGFKVWWDPKLRAGQRFDDVIEAAIVESRCVIVLWSALAVNSTYVRDEASLALDFDKLLPVSVDNARPPMRFRNLHTIQVTQDDSPSKIDFTEVVAECRKKLNENRPAPHRERHEETIGNQLIRAELYGSWAGAMPGVKLAQTLTLIIPQGTDKDFEAVLQITYTVRDLVFLIEEILDARLVHSTLELRGKSVQYITPAKIREYFLDSFELELSLDKQHLVGTVDHSYGRHSIKFIREARAAGGDA